MPLRRKELELSVERPLGSPLDPRSEVVRLTARFEVEGEGAGPTIEELEAALHALREELALLPGAAQGPDRPLEELVQAYRPRQTELVDLLRAEGEITVGEHEILRAYVAQRTPERAESPPVAPPSLPRTTAPSPAPRAAGPRSVEAVIEEYRIQSLREAGLVRARRQISFDEYMALKRHFESRGGSLTTSDATAQGA
jgi:hypothetical protein